MRPSSIAVGLATIACSVGCRSEPAADSPATTVEHTATKPPDDAGRQPSWGVCGDEPRVQVVADGLELLAIRPDIEPAVESPENCLRVLRADSDKYNLRVGSAAMTGGSMTAPKWATKNDASAAINASMFHDSGRSTGILIADGRELVGKENSKFGAFLASGPRSAALPPVTMWGRGCKGGSVAKLRSSYSTVVQNYRLLDCDGSPINWKDEKVYSAAAVGIDEDDRVLFIHLRAPQKMSAFTKILANPSHNLRLKAAMYVEGGPEATLYVRNPDRDAVFLGSYETNFLENHDNNAAWPLPNVLLLSPIAN